MSREELLKSLAPNCNYMTRALVEKYNPTYSLARYAAELDVPINEVYLIIIPCFIVIFYSNLFFFLRFMRL